MKTTSTRQRLDLPISQPTLVKLLKKHGVYQAFVFGSYARGEQTPKSDLDLFIKCQNGVSLFDVFDLQEELKAKAGVDIDLVTKLSPHFSEYIEPELIEIEM